MIYIYRVIELVADNTFEHSWFHPSFDRFLGASSRHFWCVQDMAAAVVPLPTLPPKESYGERFTMIRITVQVRYTELFFSVKDIKKKVIGKI